MGECVLNSLTEDILLEKYFKAWSDHDVDLVREIFHESATYDMVGKKSLSSLNEIIDYWERNKRRQRNLIILPQVRLDVPPEAPSCVFCASFIDIEEHENQTVYGRIMLSYEKGKIIRVSETYHVARAPLT